MIFGWDKTDTQNHALKDFNIKKNSKFSKNFPHEELEQYGW